MHHKKYLILKGCAGLGNRLITLCSAIEYAKKTKRILYVDWGDGQFGDKGINIFYKYFKLMDLSYIQSLDEITDYNSKTYYPPLWGQHPGASLYDLYVQDHSKYLSKLVPITTKGTLAKAHGYWRNTNSDSSIIGTDWNAIKACFRKNDIPFGGAYKTNLKEDVVFFADFCPKLSPVIFREHIALNNEPNSKINALASKFHLSSSNSIGVHVRMTDKQPQNSLDTLFRKIDSIGINNPNIFLATDNKEVENLFKQRYRNVCFTAKWRPENTGIKMGTHQYAIRTKDYTAAETMLEESITDMWLLSKCTHLIYQHNSSFSTISQYLKNNKNNTYTW